MQYTKKFDRLLFLRPDFFKVDLFFFLKTFCYGKRGCIRNFISMQPRLPYVRMSKMQGADDEDDRSLLS